MAGGPGDRGRELGERRWGAAPADGHVDVGTARPHLEQGEVRAGEPTRGDLPDLLLLPEFVG